MLQSLHVKNLALMEETEVEFGRGLNILTGETGAGKSLLIGSVNLALGGKFDREMLRKGAESALVELVFASGDKRVRVHVDAENYRLKREQSLQHLACKVAAKVAKYKRNVTLEPMNAYERHVIHTALQNVEGVTTYSMGTEPNRRVIVAYDRGWNKQG